MKSVAYYQKCKAQIAARENRVVGNYSASHQDDVPNLDRGIQKFFEEHEFGAIQIKERFFAIWKFEEQLKDKSVESSYYLFNENPDAKFASLATSSEEVEELAGCLLRFLHVEPMAELLRDYFAGEQNDKNAGERPSSEFGIHEVRLASIGQPMTDEEIEKDKATPLRPELGAYSALGEYGGLLVGSFNQASEAAFKKETRDKQQAACALVALAMSQIFDSHHWYPQVVDDVLKMGDLLTELNADKVNQSERQYLLPSELDNEFLLGINRINFEIRENQSTGSTSQFLQSIETFFKANKMGIVKQDEVIIIFWFFLSSNVNSDRFLLIRSC